MKYIGKLIQIEYSECIRYHCKLLKLKSWGSSNTYASKSDDKEKMKAINLIMQSYRMRIEMIKSEPELINQKMYMKDISIFDT